MSSSLPHDILCVSGCGMPAVGLSGLCGGCGGLGRKRPHDQDPRDSDSSGSGESFYSDSDSSSEAHKAMPAPPQKRQRTGDEIKDTTSLFSPSMPAPPTRANIPAFGNSISKSSSASNASRFAFSNSASLSLNDLRALAQLRASGVDIKQGEVADDGNSAPVKQDHVGPVNRGMAKVQTSRNIGFTFSDSAQLSLGDLRTLRKLKEEGAEMSPGEVSDGMSMPTRQSQKLTLAKTNLNLNFFTSLPNLRG